MSPVLICVLLTAFSLVVGIGSIVGNREDCYPGCIIPLVLWLVVMWMIPMACENEARRSRVARETVTHTQISDGVVELRGITHEAVRRETLSMNELGWVVISTCREGRHGTIYIVAMRREPRSQTQPSERE